MFFFFLLFWSRSCFFSKLACEAIWAETKNVIEFTGSSSTQEQNPWFGYCFLSLFFGGWFARLEFCFFSYGLPHSWFSVILFWVLGDSYWRWLSIAKASVSEKEIKLLFLRGGYCSDGRYRAVQARLEMATIPEAHILSCTNCDQSLQRQDWDSYRETLADGVQWMCEAREVFVLHRPLLEGLCCKGFPFLYWTGFSCSAPYYVELLS